MKKCILLAFGVMYLFSADLAQENDKYPEVKKFDKIFKQIGKRRVGEDPKALKRIKSPFISETDIKESKVEDDKIVVEEKIKFNLYAIFNKRVNINKKWYKLKDDVKGYKIIKIKKNSVVLYKNNKREEIFLRKKNEKISIANN